jgi:hypothetical protein
MRIMPSHHNYFVVQQVMVLVVVALVAQALAVAAVSVLILRDSF